MLVKDYGNEVIQKKRCIILEPVTVILLLQPFYFLYDAQNQLEVNQISGKLPRSQAISCIRYKINL